jgi:diphosphomevalonate decarboxylase
MNTVFSPANIAFIKHWGMSPEGLPLAPSLSMNLSNCYTLTKVSEADFDEVRIYNPGADFKVIEKNIDSRDDKIFKQIELVRKLSGSTKCVLVESKNSFYMKAGIASSASGFSALTLALCDFFGVDLNRNELANLIAKAGSISAVRSVCNNFGKVELLENGGLKVTDCPEFEDLDLVDMVVVLSKQEKATSSFEGQMVAETSPLFYARLEAVKRNEKDIITAAKVKDIDQIGHLIELESTMLHSVMMTSSPAQFYMNHNTFKVFEDVFKLRKQGIKVYYTVDAGCNVHLITQKLNYEAVYNTLIANEFVQEIILNNPCEGTRILSAKEAAKYDFN